MNPPYHRTTITLVVLSENPIPDTDLADIIYECDRGDYVLASCDFATEMIGKQEMAQALISAGSEPGFFSIGDDLS